MGWNQKDSCWPLALPFSFPFYSNSYQTVYVSSNGLITLLAPDDSGVPSTAALTGRPAIAPAWHDWSTIGSLEIYVGQDGPSHLTIRWEISSASGIQACFVVTLSAGGLIEFSYGSCNETASAVEGISNGLGHVLAQNAVHISHARTVVYAPFQITHDLAVSLEAPMFLVSSNSVVLNATASNAGSENETDVDLWLAVNGTIVNSVRIQKLNLGCFYTLGWSWTPSCDGVYNITAYAPKVSGEAYSGNNMDSRTSVVTENESVYVSVDPQAMNVVVGDVFTVNVNVFNVQQLFAWQVQLFYNASILKCLRVWVPTNNVFSDHNSYVPEPLIEKNYTLVGATLMGYETTFVGSGVLCQMVFEAEAFGNSALLLDSRGTLLANSVLNRIDCTFKNGFVRASLADFNSDGKTDSYDVTVIVDAYGSHAGDETWNAICDMNNDSVINVIDVAMTCRVFGRTYESKSSQSFAR